jgi:hypothetical protein
MTRVGCTGHQGFPSETAALVDREIREHLARYVDLELVGLTNLADGADQLFAQAVLDLGGALEVIVPAEQYRDGFPTEASKHGYDELFAHARRVDRLPFSESTPESHMAASEVIVDRCDVLLAVWDGEPSRGYGGTADVVAYARKRETPVEVLWPEGATRD